MLDVETGGFDDVFEASLSLLAKKLLFHCRCALVSCTRKLKVARHATVDAGVRLWAAPRTGLFAVQPSAYV